MFNIMVDNLDKLTNIFLTVISATAGTIAWIKARAAKKCIECNYKQRAEKEEIVAELKSMARRKIEEVEGLIKSNYLTMAMQYIGKESLLQYPPYLLFITCFDSVKTRMMSILIEDFYKNHLNKYTNRDIRERADYLFKQIVDIFDCWYCPESPPCRIELYDKTKELDNQVIDILRSIYETAKDLK